MANALFAKGKEKILSATINWTSDTIKAALMSNAYAQNLTTDEFFSQISTNSLGTTTLSNKSVTNGVFDADDIEFTAVAGGSVTEGIVLYKDTGNPATSPVLAYIDTITGFPLTTNGGSVIVQWDNGAYKIFSL